MLKLVLFNTALLLCLLAASALNCPDLNSVTFTSISGKAGQSAGTKINVESGEMECQAYCAANLLQDGTTPIDCSSAVFNDQTQECNLYSQDLSASGTIDAPGSTVFIKNCNSGGPLTTNGPPLDTTTRPFGGTTIRTTRFLPPKSTTPSSGPTAWPTDRPTDAPAPWPTDNPNPRPTDDPTPWPTDTPNWPTDNPNPWPTDSPNWPTDNPNPGPPVDPNGPDNGNWQPSNRGGSSSSSEESWSSGRHGHGRGHGRGRGRGRGHGRDWNNNNNNGPWNNGGNDGNWNRYWYSWRSNHMRSEDFNDQRPNFR